MQIFVLLAAIYVVVLSDAIGARASVSVAGAGLLHSQDQSGVAAVAGPTLPGRFQDAVVIGGLSAPTAIRFSPDGRVFVAEKGGAVLEYDSLTDTTPTTVVDLRSEVNSYGDRGLLGFTLDPQFPVSPYIYLLYTYDAPPGRTAPVWNDACPGPPAGGGHTDGCPVTGKLVRITLAGNVIAGSPRTLIQGEWCQQFESHSIGDLNFGPDGYLYAAGGDGASFTGADWGQFGGSLGSPVEANPCADPPAGTGGAETSPTAEGGALRSQSVRRASNEPVLLDGTIIRVDPSTGAGAPTNPFASSPGTNKQRIIAYGMRNPFRFTFRPGTTDLWIGDVGWDTWEEIDVDNNVTTATNYGWPCYEGHDQVIGFAPLDLCSRLTAGSVTNPFFAYKHLVSVVPSETCPTTSSVISGISFYDGETYPVSYDGALFIADHSRNCIWVMLPGSNGLPDPSSIRTFDAGAAHPVDLVAGPGGDLFYVDIDDGEIHRISYAALGVTLTAPIAGSVTNAATPTVSGAAGTATGDLSTVTVRSYNGSTASGTAVQTLTTTAGGASWSATVSAPLSDGQYTAQAEQDDSAGNHGFSRPTTFTVDTTPPINRSVPAIVGAPSVGQMLRCSPGSWSGRTQQTYSDRWWRDGRAISGATGALYRIAPADARHMLACQVTARSIAGSTGATSKALLARAAAGSASVGRARVRGRVAMVLISCGGIMTQSCTAVLSLTVTEKRRGSTIIALAAARSRGNTSTRTVVLGRHRVVLRGGARTTVHLALNEIGRRLLSRRSRLPVKLTTTQRTSRRHYVVDAQVLTFRARHKP